MVNDLSLGKSRFRLGEKPSRLSDWIISREGRGLSHVRTNETPVYKLAIQRVYYKQALFTLL